MRPVAGEDGGRVQSEVIFSTDAETEGENRRVSPHRFPPSDTVNTEPTSGFFSQFRNLPHSFRHA